MTEPERTAFATGAAAGWLVAWLIALGLILVAGVHP